MRDQALSLSFGDKVLKLDRTLIKNHDKVAIRWPEK